MDGRGGRPINHWGIHTDPKILHMCISEPKVQKFQILASPILVHNCSTIRRIFCAELIRQFFGGVLLAIAGHLALLYSKSLLYGIPVAQEGARRQLANAPGQLYWIYIQSRPSQGCYHGRFRISQQSVYEVCSTE